MGDVLLLQGTPREREGAGAAATCSTSSAAWSQARLNRSRAPLAAAIFALAIVAATLKLASLPVAMLGGAFLMLLTRCLSPEEAYRQVEWKALILIGALLSLGAAMEASGAGKYLAQQLIGVVGADSHYALLTCFFLLTVALTQPMSNQAAALVVLPIAMQTALQLGVDPRAFAMMVAVAASCSYLTPLEPSCLMVYGPGQVSVLRLLQGRRAADRADLRHGHRAGAVGVGVVGGIRICWRNFRMSQPMSPAAKRVT